MTMIVLSADMMPDPGRILARPDENKCGSGRADGPQPGLGAPPMQYDVEWRGDDELAYKEGTLPAGNSLRGKRGQAVRSIAIVLTTALVVYSITMKLFGHSAWALVGLCALDTAHALTPYKVQTPPLDTDWTYKVGKNPWPEHPRPQLRRDAWQSLNGIWTWRAANSTSDVDSPPSAGKLDKEVLVPSCIESALSGLQILDVHQFWYETTFKVPSSWKKQKVLLHFEAVDYESTIFVNGKNVSTNVGGYTRTSIDVTDHVKFGESNDLLVFVSDPTDSEVIPVGKQTLNPSHIFYRPCSGIWQTVWIEPTPKDYITQLDVAAGSDGKVTVHAHSSSGKGGSVEVAVVGKGGSKVGSGKGTADKDFTFTVKSPKLWWPESPNLYNLTVTFGDDEILSYTGFRTVSVGEVKGVKRHLLNGEFVFQVGTLDQGYWPDGLYTPPNREAMVYDLKVLKNLGFNRIRKHIKVEPDLFYQACDEMGIMLFQDMPSLPASKLPNAAEQAEFQRQLEIIINEHKSYTSIVGWVIYNEGWGQLLTKPYPEELLTKVVRGIDPSRLIDSVTGWHDHGFGDYSDNHHYAEPQCGTPFYSSSSSPYDPKRVGIQGEFGGIGQNVSLEHLWKVPEAIDQIYQTYEINENIESYNWRAKRLWQSLRDQTEDFSCSGAIYTQTTDVEGEVNGLLTYDRRVLRPDVKQWQKDIQSLYDAAAKRGGRKTKRAV